MDLYKALVDYSKEKIVPMHMPGHKRKKNILNNKLPYQIDITEIDGFDTLYNCNSILKECQDKATNLYNSLASFYLVNGSTSGLLTAISSCCDINDKIILPRNCHKAVYNIIELLNLKCVFIPLELDENGIVKSLNLLEIKKIVNNNLDAKCLILTSPTYEGVISDITGIAKIVHRAKMKLIVDEAHGAHLFLENRNAVNKGADIVINSLHKTLPSLTQTAMLHVCSKRVDLNRIRKNISIFNSSSPSYILMASIDECINYMRDYGLESFSLLQKNLKEFYEKIKKLKFLKILTKNDENDFYDFDNTKIIILTKKAKITGHELAQLLRQNSIEIEMDSLNYCICMSTIFDSKKDLEKLAKVLLKIDKDIPELTQSKKNYDFSAPTIMTSNEAMQQKSKQISLKKAIGKIAGEYVWVYPPGIPILIPGEKITTKIYDYIVNNLQNDLNVQSTYNDIVKYKIYVLDK